MLRPDRQPPPEIIITSMLGLLYVPNQSTNARATIFASAHHRSSTPHLHPRSPPGLQPACAHEQQPPASLLQNTQPIMSETEMVFNLFEDGSGNLTNIGDAMRAAGSAPTDEEIAVSPPPMLCPARGRHTFARARARARTQRARGAVRPTLHVSTRVRGAHRKPPRRVFSWPRPLSLSPPASGVAVCPCETCRPRGCTTDMGHA